MILIYRENGWVAEVQLIAKTEDKAGESFKLKVMKTLYDPYFISPENAPQPGSEFTVWRAHSAGVYAGWFLSESFI